MPVIDDIAFLERFRDTIEEFLVVGSAPTQDPLWGGSGLVRMKEAMQDPAFRVLRRDINRMKGRAARILEGLGIGCTFEQYPPPAVGGPILKFPLFDLITDNQSLHTVDGSVFTDKIDAALGLIQDAQLGSAVTVAGATGSVLFLAPADDAENDAIHRAVMESAVNAGMTVSRLGPGGDLPGALANAALVVADIGDGNPDICWQAGYSQGYGMTVVYLRRNGQKPVAAFPDGNTLLFDDPGELAPALSDCLKDLSDRSS